jgi:hypothetical protein
MMSDFKNKLKVKAQKAANATKKTAEKVVDKPKDVIEGAGKKLEEGNDRLRHA